MSSIVVIGGGGHAKVVISILKKLSIYQITGYTDLKDRSEILGVPFVGDDSVLESMAGKNSARNAVLGLGMLNNKDANKRHQLFQEISRLGYAFPNIASPDAFVNEGVSIGEGTVVMGGAVVNSGSDIGTGVILNTRSCVDHDCKVGDFSHIAPGATLSGGVKIGNKVLVGAGAVIREYRRIIDNCIIGVGAVIIDDIVEQGTYVGNPARRL